MTGAQSLSALKARPPCLPKLLALAGRRWIGAGRLFQDGEDLAFAPSVKPDGDETAIVERRRSGKWGSRGPDVAGLCMRFIYQLCD